MPYTSHGLPPCPNWWRLHALRHQVLQDAFQRYVRLDWYSESTYCPRFSLKILLLHQLHFHRQMMRSGKSVRYARPHGCDRDQCVLPKWLKHIHFLRKNQMIGTCVYSQKDCPIQKTDFILLVLIVLVKVKSKKVQYSLHQWIANVNFSLKHKFINT